MNIVTNIQEWRAINAKLINKAKGLVPTMGNLHAGHLSLCRQSQNDNEVTIVTIFVNPTQFNEQSDFKNYPRTLENDFALLQKQNIDFVFVPQAEEMFADNYEVQMTENNISLQLEGKHRPGHFNGVLTIVLKLLNLIQPTRAYFGEKDYQQLLLIKKMVQALLLPVDIIDCTTERAEDGLALSSRNSRLSRQQREQAKIFPQLLNSTNSINLIIEKLKLAGFSVDYIAEQWQRRLGAVWLGDVRLIDNFPLK